MTARALGEVELYPGHYGKEPPYDLARARPVYVVDFSYPREQLQALYKAADAGWTYHMGSHALIVLDHHKTAQAALEGLPYCTFDMERSGAGMAWDYFHPGEPRPWLVDYVEDRDLWRHKLPHAEAISTFIRCSEYTLDAWDHMAQFDVEDVRKSAYGCTRYLAHYVRETLRQAYTVDVAYQAPSHFGAPADLDWHAEPAIALNLPYLSISEVLHAALEQSGRRLALSWYLVPDGKLTCSLRSTKDLDCSAIAKSFGGGGHAQASGFKLDVDHPLARLLLRPEARP